MIAPVIAAVDPRRIIEIGALRGETTARLLEGLGTDCEVHVVDPEPQFDPAEHEARFPGRYVFHRTTSHEVLPDLPPFDVALIDGDHNWFTVRRELDLLAARARNADAALPVLILHDVGWPYGRRDLYYEPSRIPEEFRQPHRQGGMRQGTGHLLDRGGMNATLHHALHEGGERNGVLTALDDFMAGHDRPLRRVVLPIYYGLALVADEQRLTEAPALARILDHYEGEAGLRELIDLGERIRIEEATFTQSWVRNLQEQNARSASRYLDLAKAILRDEHYIENELRLEYLLSLVDREVVDPDALRDPVRFLPVRARRLLHARTAGHRVDDRTPAYFPFSEMGRAQSDHIDLALTRLELDAVAGDVLEVGPGRSGGAILMRAFLEAHEVGTRRVWIADTFSAQGTAEATPRPDLNQLRDAFARLSLLDDQVRFLQGRPSELLADPPFGPLALVRIGPDSASETDRLLDLVAPHLSEGAEVIVSGAGSPALERSIDAARHRHGWSGAVERVDGTTWAWRVGDGQPLADLTGTPGAAPESIDLSVVVVFHNMPREARRTLLSLSRSYQRDIEDVDYEVIAIDNGSDPEQRLDGAFVRGFGPEFRLLTLGEEASSSPTSALNQGIAVARGRSLALMIDGAHVLTPGVLHNGILAMQTYAPAVVATQQWYVGPGQQGDVQQAGYEQAAEDRLFDRIRWPSDGYRLFEISHFIGDRDWFDGIVESNCLFVPRAVLEQYGAFDDAFAMPGGGYANLDLFERIGLAPGINVASILGEGTFHQVHGGTTTNVTDADIRRERVSSYRKHFEDLRGRPLIGLDRPVHFVGAMSTKAARRTRSRRHISGPFSALRDPNQGTVDAQRLPVPEELRHATTEALWYHQSWRDTSWMGRTLHRFPTDLQVYQELVMELQPETILLVADDQGLVGRAHLMASLCDLRGGGQVLAVGPAAEPPETTHPRVRTRPATPEDAATTTAALLAEVGAGTVSLVFLGLGSRAALEACFEQVSGLVPAGGFVVVENTVVNGRPVAPEHGPGPHEAVVSILGRHPEFVADATAERYALTFNRGGYLRRREVPPSG